MENRIYIPKYFAGSLTGAGFTNFLPEALRGIEKIYIIKGTPGSGKSTLMRKIANTAEEAEEDVERIYCSSDPTSLDGIVIPSRSLAMVDGTSPHVIEASYPLAVETIINTADYLSQNIIDENREEIISLSDEKKSLFEKAVAFLRSASALNTVKHQLWEECYDSAKGFKFCMNVINNEKKFKKEGETIRRGAFAFGRNGMSSISPFGTPEKIYSIDKQFSPFILGTLKLLCREHKLCAVYSPSPIDVNETAAVYFPFSKNLYVSAEWEKSGDRISFTRFERKDRPNRNKEKLKFILKTQNLIFEECQKYLSEAMENHMKLEKIYVSALNKDGLDCLYRSLTLSIFGQS